MNKLKEEPVQELIGQSPLPRKKWTDLLIGELRRFTAWNQLLHLMKALEVELDEQDRLLRFRR